MSDREELHVDAEDRPGPPPELRDRARGSSRAPGAFLATFALVAFAGVVWYAYDRGLQDGSEVAAPLIRSDPEPVKIRPERPGGMEIPNQDRLVFDALRPQDDQEPRVERLLPPPETPAPPPVPEADLPRGDPAADAAPLVEPRTPVAPATQSEAQTATPPAVTDEDGIPPARIETPPPPAPAVPEESGSSAAVAAGPSETPAAAGRTVSEEAAGETPASASEPSETAASPKPDRADAESAAVAETAEPETTVASSPPSSNPPSSNPPASNPPASTPPASAPASSALPAGAYRVQVAALRSEDAARGEWRRLQQRYDRELGGLELRVQRVDLGSRGVFFRVQGGSVSEAAARGICARLEEQGQACLVVAP